ncbi:hypothetical protein [Pollutibacter soli]|uniref:hypothetical protein n=1 Tax=Pollutibacter soli TaxID=3034157 RepID=UPI003014122C
MERKEEYAISAIRQYQDRLNFIRSNSILSPVYFRKKILFWFLRSLSIAVIYFLFWKYHWVRWTLVLSIPVSVLNIVSVFTWKYLLQQKLKRNEQELHELQTQSGNSAE